jgi:hypothetical protein
VKWLRLVRYLLPKRGREFSLTARYVKSGGYGGCQPSPQISIYKTLPLHPAFVTIRREEAFAFAIG